MTVLGRTNALAVVVAAAMTIAVASPANADGADLAQAHETAAAVKRVTGTGDLVPSTADRDSAAVAVTIAGRVDVPLNTGGEVYVGDGPAAIALGLPDTTTGRAVKDASGTVVFADASAPADVAVQPTNEGVRALVLVKNAKAPSSFRFPVRGPVGSRLVTAATLLGNSYGTGEVLLLGADSQLLGLFQPAWARTPEARPWPPATALKATRWYR